MIEKACFQGAAAVALCAGLLSAVPAHGGSGGLAAFTEEAVGRGLVFQMAGYPVGYGYLGWGCGFADLDGDGDEDIVIIGASNRRVGIFENDGTGNFIDRSLTSGIPLLPEGSAFAAADYDGDGDLDLYLTQMNEPNVLARNEGNFTFTDVAAAAGVDDDGPSKAPSFGDYNGDGWLDIYLCNYFTEGPTGPENKLYRNRGDGTFADVTLVQDVQVPYSESFQAVWFDYDKDGDVDLYLSNDRGHQNNPSSGQLFPSNQLFRNDGGNLVNVSVGSGADLRLFSMGVACGDFDGNGWADLYTTNIPGGGGMNNPLMLNQGDGTFVEDGVAAGVDNPWTSWGAFFWDFDNDTQLELYVNNQWCPNTLFRRLAAFPCVEIAGDVGLQGTMTGINPCYPPIPQPNAGVSFVAAHADVDGDGDLDVLENNLGSNVQLYINNEGTERNWIRYRVVGAAPNLHAVGARVETTAGGLMQLREILAGGNGYLGQNELTVHVGLGANAQADSVFVSWPGGSPTRTFTNLPANHVWTILPPDALGDADGDGDRELDDFLALVQCFGAPFAPGCEVFDFDGDSDVDFDDGTAFAAAYDGTLEDCNGNLQADLLDILDGTSSDTDGDGVPDECGSVPGDVTGDGVVDVSDLVAVILAWGPCPGCDADLDGSGVVDVTDLVTVILNWG